MHPTDIKTGSSIGDIKILDIVVITNPIGPEVSRDASDIRDSWSQGRSWIRVQIQEPFGEPSRWVTGWQVEEMCDRRRKALKGLTSTTVTVHGVDVPVSMVPEYAWDAWEHGLLTDADLETHRKACGAVVEWLGHDSAAFCAEAWDGLNEHEESVLCAIVCHNDPERWHEFYEYEPDPDAHPRAEPEYWRD